MTAYLLKTNKLNSAQHGFLAGHSTATNLLQSLNDWTVSLKNGLQTRVVNIDFSKAFDSICHSKLLLKLGKYGFDGKLLSILQAFLYDRSQRVRISNSVSGSAKITSGVPQGSVLGPLLFIIFINDLADIFTDNITSKFFADDAKLYTVIRSNIELDTLQSSTDLLCKWASDWQLTLSIPKCNFIDFYTKVNKYTEFSLYLLVVMNLNH